MSPTRSSLPAASLARFRAHVQTPLYRNAYAWLVSMGISSALGILYWVLAARYYAREAVGFNAALISILIFIAGISQLNLMSALIRFLPTAGPETARLTAGSYLVSMGVAGLISAAFVALGARWAGFDAFGADAPLAALFIPAAMAWTVFTLQDGVLTGLRAALWVPVDNISYGILKLILLVVLAPVSPRFGLFISWMVPAILLLVPINLVIFKQLIPRHVRLTKSAAAPLDWRELSKYVGSNYFGSLFALSASRLLPALVVAVAGAAAGAYFYLAWAISDSLKLVTTQMATSLTVEGALDDHSVTVNGHAFLRLLFGLFVPLIGVLLVAAPALLRLSGEAYAVEGAAVLRLLSLAVIPSLFITWYLSIARVRHQLREILCVEGLLALLILGLSYLLLQAFGMIGVGIASVIAATVVAAALLPQLRSVLLPIRRPVPHELNPDSAA